MTEVTAEVMAEVMVVVTEAVTQLLRNSVYLLLKNIAS
jgi:hypothetical protein